MPRTSKNLPNGLDDERLHCSWGMDSKTLADEAAGTLNW